MTIGGFTLQTPLALLLLLLLPAWWLWLRRRKRGAIVFSRAHLLARAPRAGRGIARAIVVLQNVVLAAVIVALARPQSSGRVEEELTEGINIVIAFDISSSMLALDFQPRNRLEVARQSVKRFVAMRPGDRIGLVAFAGEALTQVPLTTDHAVVQLAIDGLQPGQLEDGTAIGTAVATSANRLRAAEEGARVLVLITDGVNNRGMAPLSAARAAEAFGVRIYGVGVGSEGFALMPVERDARGLVYSNQRVQIDDALLTEIARLTGGQYFRATDAAALDRIAAEIDRLERTPVEIRRYVLRTELYPLPLAVALAALAAVLGLIAWRAPIP